MPYEPICDLPDIVCCGIDNFLKTLKNTMAAPSFNNDSPSMIKPRCFEAPKIYEIPLIVCEQRTQWRVTRKFMSRPDLWFCLDFYQKCIDFGFSYDLWLAQKIQESADPWAYMESIIHGPIGPRPPFFMAEPGTFSAWYMTSPNGNIFRVIGPLCGEFTGPGEFPALRPVTRSFDVFFDLRLNKRLSKQPWGWWFDSMRRHRGH